MARRTIIVGVFVLAATAMALMARDLARAGSTSDCTPAASGEAVPAPNAVTPEVTLKPDENSKLLTWKFGRKRDEHSWLVKIVADPNLNNLQANQIEIETARLNRSDNSEQLAKPTFTAPRISNDRKRIGFTVCVTAKGGAPGSYSGAISVSGPAGVSATTSSINVTLKERRLFFGGVELLVFLATLAVLALKAMGDYKKAEFDKVREEDKKKWSWGKALLYNWSTPAGIITSLVAIGTTVVGAYLLYHKSDTWGADLAPDLLALGSSALTAVGIQGGLGGIVDAFSENKK